MTSRLLAIGLPLSILAGTAIAVLMYPSLPLALAGLIAASLAPTDVSVELVDYGFELPDTIDGDALLEVTNDSAAEPHEMEVARLDDGSTVDDVRRALERRRSAPSTPIGGMQGLLPGASQRLQLDLDPGRYVVICEVPRRTGRHTMPRE